MNEQVAVEASERPSLWRRIVDFPLVTMLMATVLYIITIGVVGAITKLALPPIRGMPFEVELDLLAAPALILLYWAVIGRLGKRPRNEFRDAHALRNLGVGLGAGFAVFSIAVAVAAVLGVYRITGEGDASGLFAAFVGAAIFPAVSEEMLFRGILFRWIEEFGGSWLALLLTSAFFGAAHLMNPQASSIAAVGIALEAGVMLGAAYMLTRSLWLPMGLHGAWNFTQGEIWDIPVSGTKVHGIVDARLAGDPLLTGNGFGLEASVIAIVVATLFGLWLLSLAIRRGELRPPMWARDRALA